LSQVEMKRKTKVKAKKEKFDQEKVSTPTFKIASFPPSQEDVDEFFSRHI